MNKFILFFLLLLQVGCNYNLSKTPLSFQQGPSSLEQIPSGTVVSYQVIATSIMASKCIECHSSGAGDAGGINLETYANVAGNLDLIKSEVASDSMPKNRAKLSPKEKDILFTWINAGGLLTPGSVVPAPTPTPAPTPAPPPQVEFITYEMVHTQVLQPRCIGCHSVAGGDRGKVNLETYENVAALANSIESEIQSGSMPRPKNKPLTQEQKDLILKWLANGAPRNSTPSEKI